MEEWKAIASNYEHRWQFPLCLGALDGKHIAFRASKSHGALYYNYKGFNSIVLLALAGADYKFHFVDIGCNGRISDGGVLNRSALRQIIAQADRYFPADEIIGSGRKLPYTIIGDDAFPLEVHIMKPYPYSSIEKQKRIFNFRLSHARQTVEHSFGILANRFRVLQTTMHLRPHKVVQVVQAICVLHNFLISNSQGYVDPIGCLNRTAAENGESRNTSETRNYSNTAADVRSNFAEYFSNEGELPWQDSYL